VKLFNRNNENKNIEKSNKSFIDRAWDLQRRLETRQQSIGKGKYGRVLKMARKPTNEEYSKTAKITSIGILLIGGLGFLIFFITTQIVPWVAKHIGFK